jgi:hypothetical protein
MQQSFDNFKYDHLSHLQIGRIGEYWVKIWLTLLRYETYYNDIDDRGIDFILRLDNYKHIDIQVKTIRSNTGYVFVTKDTWNNKLRENLYLALVLINNNEMPTIYFIPSTAWNTPNDLLKDRDYDKEGQRSKPEWGINVSKKNMELLEQYNIQSFKENVQLINSNYNKLLGS